MKVFENESGYRNTGLLDIDSVVHKVLGTGPSVADGGNDGIQSLQPVIELFLTVAFQ